jgi:hypothetical protein
VLPYDFKGAHLSAHWLTLVCCTHVPVPNATHIYHPVTLKLLQMRASSSCPTLCRSPLFSSRHFLRAATSHGDNVLPACMIAWLDSAATYEPPTKPLADYAVPFVEVGSCSWMAAALLLAAAGMPTCCWSMMPCCPCGRPLTPFKSVGTDCS